MTKGEFFINDSDAEELRAHYEVLQKRIDAYQKELSRAFAEWQVKKETMEKAYGGSPPQGPLFCVYGKNLALEEMAGVQDQFLKSKPENKKIELMFLLHEKGDLEKIREIMSEGESFLRELPGASVPGRPEAMEELMKNKI